MNYNLQEPIIKAIEKAGGQTALARRMNDFISVSQSHVWNWLNRNKKVPSSYVIPMEKATGISKHEIRPDIYPKE